MALYILLDVNNLNFKLDNLTTIQIQKQTRLDLLSISTKGQSYDSLVQELILLKKEKLRNEYTK